MTPGRVEVIQIGTESVAGVVGTDGLGTLIQTGGVVGVLALVLYLIVQRGALRSDREVKDRDAQIAKLEAACAREVADLRTQYEARISRLEAVISRNETMIFELSGAARALAEASKRKEARSGRDDG